MFTFIITFTMASRYNC